jgi:hypothetical protein
MPVGGRGGADIGGSEGQGSLGGGGAEPSDDDLGGGRGRGREGSGKKRRQPKKDTIKDSTSKDSVVDNVPVVKPKVGTAGLKSEVQQRRGRKSGRRASILSDVTEEDISSALLGRPRGR